MVFRPASKDQLHTFLFMGGLLLLQIGFVLYADISRDRPFTTDMAILVGLFLALIAFLAFIVWSQKIIVSEDEIAWFSEFTFLRKRMLLKDIARVEIGHGAQFRKYMVLLLSNGTSIEILVSLWTEKSLIPVLRELKRRNPKIDIGEKYEKILATKEPVTYSRLVKESESAHLNDLARQALLPMLLFVIPMIVLAWFAYFSDLFKSL